jgi:hypothetical protein
MSNYELLKQKIQKKIPNLIKFEIGCKFKILNEYLPEKLFNEVCVITDIHNSEWESLSYIFEKEYIRGMQFFKEGKLFNTKTPFIYELFDEYNYDSFESKQEDFIEIIGKDPMLNDVLFWLNNLDNANILSIMRFNDTFKWNLSKPYLKDQSTELIDWLNTLG